MTSASVQAAVYVREKQRLRLNKKNNLNKGRFELPTHIATRDIAPFPTYPPQTWVSTLKSLFMSRIHFSDYQWPKNLINLVLLFSSFLFLNILTDLEGRMKSIALYLCCGYIFPACNGKG